MKKITLVICVFIFNTYVQAQDCPVLNLPENFILDQKILTWSTTLNIYGSKKENKKFYGRIRAKILAWTPSFEVYNEDDQLVGSTRQTLLSWGTDVKVFDCRQRLIGSFKEKVWESLLKTWTEYNVLDEKEQIIALSNKTEFLDTSIELKSNRGQRQVYIYRDFWNLFGDVWSVKVSSDNQIDPVVYLAMAAYKTYVDDQRAAESSRD